MTKGGVVPCSHDMIARATRGDEGGGRVAREEAGKGVSRDVRGDGRFGCDVATALPAVGVSLEPASRGAMQSRRACLVDVKGHVRVLWVASNIFPT